MKAGCYFSADSGPPVVSIDKHPSNALTIGDVRLVFEDHKHLEAVVLRIIKAADRSLWPLEKTHA